LPLAEGDYELTVAFDSRKFAGMHPKGIELALRWDAKPVRFAIRGAARTDPVEILKVAGQKANEKYIETDLISENAARRGFAWQTIWDYGDSRLREYLEKSRTDHAAFYLNDRADFNNRLRPYSNK
jgi:hypothetical protein